jgi:sucrose-6-phosphate hydrolase SacC (GH32 family)
MKQRLWMSLVIGCVVSGYCTETEPTKYVFSFFRNNGEKGVYLAVSDDALTWREVNGGKPVLEPKVGGKLTRDPSICRGPDGLYHMVWTTSWKDKGFGAASSSNLLDWSEQAYIEVNRDEPKARNTWAPEIFYDQASQQYVVIWSTTIDGLFPETQVAKDGGDNHRIYVTTSKDFVTWTPKRLFYNGGFNVIDAFLFRKEGKYGMVVKDETRPPVAEKNLRVVWSEGGVDGPWSKAEAPFTNNKEAWAEGPSVIQVGERWLIYYDKYNKGGYGAVETTDFKTFKPVSVSLPKGIRHGTVLAVPSTTLQGERWK